MKKNSQQTTLSETVINAVAEAEACDTTELNPPLGTVVDTDALNALFTDRTDGTGWIVFDYDGYEVTVTSDGHASISEPPE